MSVEAWPPAADDATRWQTIHVRHGYADVEDVRVRQVPLWGRSVLINDEGDVWCPSCQRFVSTRELGTPGNGHPVGIRWSENAIYVTDEEAQPLTFAEQFMRRRW